MKRDELKLNQYPFSIRPLSAEDGGGFLIEFPDVPGCISDGETPEEAIVNGLDALKGCLLSYKEAGDARPKPGSAPAQWRQRIPKSLHARLAVQAEQNGVSLNTLVTTMIAEGLGRYDVQPGAKAKKKTANRERTRPSQTPH